MEDSGVVDLEVRVEVDLEDLVGDHLGVVDQVDHGKILIYGNTNT
jgi:hypothetical protein